MGEPLKRINVKLLDCVSQGLINDIGIAHPSMQGKMLRQLPLLIVLSLSFQVPQTVGHTKCKGLTKGPLRGGPSPGMGTGAVIKVKPKAEYTKAALRRQVQGTVTLRVVLHSSGQVRDVCVVEGLPYGLTKRAVDAAYRIEFEPAVKEGHPISVTTLVQYEFSSTSGSRSVPPQPISCFRRTRP